MPDLEKNAPDMAGQSFGFFKGYCLGYNSTTAALAKNSRSPMWQWIVNNNQPCEFNP
jgi:hypothetical protein